MSVYLNFEKQKIKNVDKITRVPGIEILQSKKEGKLYGVKYFLFNSKFKTVPLAIRFVSKSKRFEVLESIDIFDKAQNASVVVKVKPTIKKDKVIMLISKLINKINYNKFINETASEYNSESVSENYLNEADKEADFEFNLDKLGMVTSILAVLTSVIALSAVLKYYIIKFKNAKEVYNTRRLEEKNNRILFQGQKYDESAFEMYTNLQTFLTNVIKGKSPAAILCGPPGTSKTYMVRRVCYFEGLKYGKDYTIEKGAGVSMLAVYDMLYQNRNKILVLDDFDTPLNDPDTINLLKAITDSYDKRIVSISRERIIQSGDQVESSTPAKFEHTGKVIIITNKKKSNIDKALLSRAPAFEVGFSPKEFLENIGKLLKFIHPKVDIKIKEEVFNYILKLNKKKKINVDFRAFKNSIDARICNERYWKEMVRIIVDYD